MAVPLAFSRQGTLLRYLDQVQTDGAGRWTPGEHHDLAANAGIQTAHDLVSSGLVDRIAVFGRDQEVFLEQNVDNNLEAADAATTAIETGREITRITQSQAQQWANDMDYCMELLDHLPDRHNEDVWQVANRLIREDAPAIVERAFTEPEQRQAALERWDNVTHKHPHLLPTSFPQPAHSSLEKNSTPTHGETSTHRTQTHTHTTPNKA